MTKDFERFIWLTTPNRVGLGINVSDDVLEIQSLIGPTPFLMKAESLSQGNAETTSRTTNVSSEPQPAIHDFDISDCQKVVPGTKFEI